MPTTTTKHHQLNSNQIYYLKLLYKFRFATTIQLSQYRKKNESSATQRAINILLDQKYVGCNYDNSYKLQGRAASYYLLTKGIRALKQLSFGELKVFHGIYKDKSASEQLIGHYLSLSTICNRLKATYGDRLTYFSKSELAPADFDYFPHPLPDSYIQLGTNEFFLNYFETSRPIFTDVAKIIKYIEYADASEWGDDEPLPALRLVCETLALEKRLHKKIRRLSQPSGLDISTTTMERLVSEDNCDMVWSRADEPDEMVSIDAISSQL
jgi:hypothetical protein